MTSDLHSQEVSSGKRFAFGENWSRFLDILNEERIAEAKRSLEQRLPKKLLAGARFLDCGCGSGLFSLAARELGATVHSFDFDPQSVACTTELRRRYRPDDSGWSIGEGSVLNPDYLRSLGRFDVVYSWGVLHHTGEMWRALDLLATECVGQQGLLFIALYNDQGSASSRWRSVKRLYNKCPSRVRPLVIGPVGLYIWAPPLLLDLIRRRPFESLRSYGTSRGMSAWRDLVDWVGGYPFEVAKPEAVLAFLQPRGFALAKLLTCGGGRGCNEYVFVKA